MTSNALHSYIFISTFVLGIITSCITLENSGVTDPLSFSVLKPSLIDTFKTIFDVSAIRIALEFSTVTKNENGSIEFMVHVNSSNYNETQRIENITTDSNFTTFIQNVTRDRHNLTLEVKKATSRMPEPYLGTFIHSTNTRTPMGYLNTNYEVAIKLFKES